MNKNKINSVKSPQRSSNGQHQNNPTKKRRRGKKSKSSASPRDDQQNSKPKLSYAARISSASVNPSKKSSLRIRSGACGREYESAGSPRQSLHGNMCREDLLRIRMQQRDICYVAGLPKSICTRAILGSKKWFGQFGKIRDITITDNQNCIRTNWMCVHIKYFENISALRAVQVMNHKKLDDGRVLEANYGTQRYCEFFINNKKCHKSNCPFRHSWCKLNEIVNFNHHHQIISNTIAKPKHSAPPQPQPQAVQPQAAQPQPPPQPQPVPMIRPQAIEQTSVASTSSTDLKQNDINIGSDHNKNDENMIDYAVSDNNEEAEETQTNDIVHEQQMEMHELYQELQCIKEENKTHKLQLIEMQTQIQIKDVEIIKLQKISRRLYEAHSRLKSENDALQKHNNELLEQINKKNTQCSLDLLDYTLWTWHDVLQWIVSIQNGKFEKYQEVLQVNLKLENIDGSCIKCLTVNDIHRIGIVDYKDKQVILECIANLKSNLGLDNLINDIINTDTHCINVNVNS
eukprot:106166_1